MTQTILLVIVLLLQAAILAALLLRRPAPPPAPDFAPTHDRIDAARREVADSVRREAEMSRQASAASAAQLREEVARSLKDGNDTLVRQLGQAQDQQSQRLDAFAHKLGQFGSSVADQLDKSRAEAAAASRASREEVLAQLKIIGETSAARNAELAREQKAQLESLTKEIRAAIEAGRAQAEQLRQAVEKQLAELREDNSKKLEQMRATVEEKLQGTLEKRLGDSFRLVSERLELVHKGLGEMQTLASGVGDLKKVLSNVKVRGNWGEVQLGNLLEQMLTPEQYGKNVAVTGEGRDRVEFAIKLPGKNDSAGPVWLPIDAKFPQADYQRLVDASERADAEGVEAASKALELAVWGFARTIRDKYLRPPHTTDFGILFLPTEGLYAEVLRRPGLADQMQRELRIVIAGPTTLTALLNSLQMGFHTLAIEKQSGEVAKVLAAVRVDFTKFSDALKKIKTKLEQASDTIDEAQRRTVQIGKKLQKAGGLAGPDDESLPGLPPPTGVDENGDRPPT